MRILVDSNLIARLVQHNHPHHLVARDAVEILRTRNDDLCFVPQVIYEFWVVATRPCSPENGLGMSGEQAQREVQAVQKLFTFIDDKPGLLDEWHGLVVRYDVRGKPAHDARLVAAMLRSEITHILTFNATDFDRYKEITGLRPGQITQNPGRI